MKKLAFVGLLSAIASFAGIGAAAAAWSSWGTITTINESGSGLQVEGPNMAANPASCYDASYATVDHTLSDEHIDRLNKVLLGAMLGGRQVRVHLLDNRCRNSRPVFDRVEMK